MATTDRTKHIEGLHHLANLIELNPDLPLPWSLNSDGLAWFVHDDVEIVLVIRALMSDAVTAPCGSGNFPVEVTGTLAGFAVSVLVAKKIALDPREGFIVPAPAMNPRLLAADLTGRH